MRDKTILVVEDDLDMKDMIKAALEVNQYDVTAVAGGKDAFTYLNSGNTPDIILLDLNLGDMDGAEFMKRLANINKCKKVKVIVVSGIDEIAMKVKQIGAHDWIKKPFELSHLYRKIEQYL